MSSPDTPHDIRPDMRVRLRETGRSFRIGLIVKDGKGGCWGLTALYVFADFPRATVVTLDDRVFATYEREVPPPVADVGRIDSYIGRVRIDPGRMGAASVEMGIVWPRELVDDREAVGTTIVAVTARDIAIGEIVEIDTHVRLGLSEAAPRWVEGATVVNIDSTRIMPAGEAGTLVISDTAEIVGLALGSVRKDSRTDLIVCPLGKYLSLNGLQLWIPPAAHWSDLDNRVNAFNRRVDADQGPDLGPIPIGKARKQQ